MAKKFGGMQGRLAEMHAGGKFKKKKSTKKSKRKSLY